MWGKKSHPMAASTQHYYTTLYTHVPQARISEPLRRYRAPSQLSPPWSSRLLSVSPRLRFLLTRRSGGYPRCSGSFYSYYLFLLARLLFFPLPPPPPPPPLPLPPREGELALSAGQASERPFRGKLSLIPTSEEDRRCYSLPGIIKAVLRKISSTTYDLNAFAGVSPCHFFALCVCACVCVCVRERERERERERI